MEGAGPNKFRRWWRQLSGEHKFAAVIGVAVFAIAVYLGVVLLTNDLSGSTMSQSSSQPETADESPQDGVADTQANAAAREDEVEAVQEQGDTEDLSAEDEKSTEPTPSNAKLARKALKSLGGWDAWSVAKVEESGDSLIVYTDLWNKPENESAATGICTTIYDGWGVTSDWIMVMASDGSEIDADVEDACWFEPAPWNE